MDGGSTFLVVEDDEGVLRTLRNVLQPFGAVHGATTIASANAALEKSESWSGFLIDLKLPDGDGLEFLARARLRYPTTPALLCTGSADPELVNRAYDLRAAFVCKPISAERVRRFANESTRARHPSRERIAAAVEEFVKQCTLTPAESALIEATVFGVSRENILKQRDVTLNTFKTQVRSILKKAQHPSLASIRDSIMRAAVRD